MAATTLEQLAQRETELARVLHAQFRRRLTPDDTRDAVADAIATAHMSRDELAALDAARLEAWVRTRAYRNAIDQIRAIDGYRIDRRPASVSIDDYAETLADGSDGGVRVGLDDELAERFAEGSAARCVSLALARLTADERRLLRLRHEDGLDVRSIAGLLGIHPKKYERLHTRAMAKLRTIFIETTAGEHCDPVRVLISRSRESALSAELSATVAAHVEACPQCHAYEKRSLKLIAMMPLPAPALASRLWSRAQELVPWLGPHGEAPVAGATAAATAAGGAGAGASSSGVLAGLGAKALATVCAGTATAACVMAVLPTADHAPRKSPPPQRVAADAGGPWPVAAPARTTAATTSTPAKASASKAAKASTPRTRRSASRTHDRVTPSLAGSGSAAAAGTPHPPPPPPAPHPPPPPGPIGDEFAP